MYQDIIVINGPVKRDNGVIDLDTIRIKARPLGRPYAWDNAPPWNKERVTNGGFVLVFECEDGAIYVQEIEWEVDPYPDATPDPRTYYYYEQYASLAEFRECGRGWLIERVLS